MSVYAIGIMPEEATVRPREHFNADADCVELYKARGAIISDSSMLISIMGARSRSQRIEIYNKFKETHRKVI